MKLKNMKLTKEQREQELSSPIALGKETYPYGLRLHLDEESIKKLGLDELPAVGKKLVLYAKVEVQSASIHEHKDGKNRMLDLQITDLCVEEETKDSARAEKKLYGG